MSVLFPPVMIGGAPIEATSYTYRGVYSATGSSYTIANVQLGDPPKPPNRRWLVFMAYAGNVTLSNFRVGGIHAGSQIFAGSAGANWRACACEIPTLSAANVTFTTSASSFVNGFLFTLVNCNGSVTADTAIASGVGDARLNIDCPARGVVLAMGYADSSSGTITSADFANLTTLYKAGDLFLTTAAAARFATAQTNLLVSYDPVSTGSMTQTAAMALAFAPT